MELKEKVHQACVEYLEDKIKHVRSAIKEIQVASFEETKSSVGDKYETGRAMAQLELEKYAAQLHEFQKQLDVVNGIKLLSNPTISGLGSLIRTDLGNFYLSVSVGPFEIDSQICYGVSAASPIGKTLKELKLGDTFQLRNKQAKILSIE
jgi:hypothetical protein